MNTFYKKQHDAILITLQNFLPTKKINMAFESLHPHLFREAALEKLVQVMKLCNLIFPQYVPTDI